MQITSEIAITEILSSIEEAFPVTFRPELAPLVNWDRATSIPIHRWYRYREAYSPMLITELDLGQRILDPFCGCGSIMVGAAQMGHVSVGIDVNPLAVFVAQVKLTPLSDDQLKQVMLFADSFVNMAANAVPWPEPSLSIVGKVFEPEILLALLQLRTAIETAAADKPPVRNFLFLAWLAILEEVGSYFKEGNGIKYRNKKRLKKGSTRRPEGEWQRARFGPDQRAFVYRAYSNQLSMMVSDSIYWRSGTWGLQKVHEGSALSIDQLLAEEKFDSIMFSPPYANRFDYFEALKVELWFGNFVNSYDELSLLRKNSIRSHLGADLTRSAIEIEQLEQLISLMDQDASSWRMGVPSALRGYFDDIYHTLVQCKKHLQGGSCYIVVGNSAFAGVIIPTDSLVAKLGLEAGFTSAQMLTVRHLTVAPQQRAMLQGMEQYMRETIVVLK